MRMGHNIKKVGDQVALQPLLLLSDTGEESEKDNCHHVKNKTDYCHHVKKKQ